PLMGGDDQAPALPLKQRVEDFSHERAKLQQHAAPWFAPAFALAVVGVVVGFVAWQSDRVAKAAGDERDGPPPSTDTCAREPGGPSAPPPITMFVVADSQLHELGGTRFPGQMEVASTLVSVARRPIELDILSAAAVIRFGSVYDNVSKAAAQDSLTLWTHLGDFADLSCSREMDRMIALVGRYGGDKTRRLAGVAPGNHDSAFTGNFDWSPYWTGACKEADPAKPPQQSTPLVYARLDKTLSDAAIEKLLVDHLAVGGSTGVVKGDFIDGVVHASPAVWGNPTARYTVTPLGVLTGTGKPRGVVAIFIDTADRLSPDYGISGRYGTFSSQQAEAIQAAAAKLKSGETLDAKDRAAYTDPWYVVFGHTPYNELTGAGREALDSLLKSFDGGSGNCEAGDGFCNGPRTLALVTAHTHHAEAHRHCVNGRLLREMVVGSVIDPPQQAAKLEIGLDARGRASVRLSTLPAVNREGLTCETPLSLPASRCHAVVDALIRAKECKDLVDPPDSGQERGKSCEELERPLSWDEQVTGLVRHGGPREPGEILVAETKRARALLRCLCRDPGTNTKLGEACRHAEPPLSGERYAKVVEALASDPKNPAQAEEATCLAWAASAVHAHKANGMTMADALRCAFDDPTFPSARVVVATSEDETCP
ncbi:MAG TPA: hypothetical protein VN903_26760, partial [Polyangia bacterium]|nr:hypothetical protein [Polyangia bacterium]